MWKKESWKLMHLRYSTTNHPPGGLRVYYKKCSTSPIFTGKLGQYFLYLKNQGMYSICLSHIFCENCNCHSLQKHIPNFLVILTLKPKAIKTWYSFSKHLHIRSTQYTVIQRNYTYSSIPSQLTSWKSFLNVKRTMAIFSTSSGELAQRE